MKKLLLLILVTFTTLGFAQTQEWMTSLDVAKRLAKVQNKMIFAIWEDAASEGYPVLIRDNKGNVLIADLFENESLNEVVWEYFVPVLISESRYHDLFNKIKEKRSKRYINKFNDDSIKIMDINGNIINVNSSYGEENMIDFSSFVAKYYLDTTFLQRDLISYSSEQNFTTSFYLASKYIDYVSLSKKEIRSEIVELSNLYLDEANRYLESGKTKNKIISAQAIELLKIKQLLVLNEPKKVIRLLKKIKDPDLHNANKALINFFYYTAYQMLNDKKNADLWKTKVSLLDLKKAKLIINSNI